MKIEFTPQELQQLIQDLCEDMALASKSAFDPEGRAHIKSMAQRIIDSCNLLQEENKHV